MLVPAVASRGQPKQCSRCVRGDVNVLTGSSRFSIGVAPHASGGRTRARVHGRKAQTCTTAPLMPCPYTCTYEYGLCCVPDRRSSARASGRDRRRVNRQLLYRHARVPLCTRDIYGGHVRTDSPTEVCFGLCWGLRLHTRALTRNEPPRWPLMWLLLLPPK